MVSPRAESSSASLPLGEPLDPLPGGIVTQAPGDGLGHEDDDEVLMIEAGGADLDAALPASTAGGAELGAIVGAAAIDLDDYQ